MWEHVCVGMCVQSSKPLKILHTGFQLQHYLYIHSLFIAMVGVCLVLPLSLFVVKQSTGG